MNYFYDYSLDFSNIFIFEKNEKITAIYFTSPISQEFIKKETKLIKETKNQLDQYFNGKSKKFDIPFALVGTDFQKSVWNALLEIPYGETKSYKDIAIKVGSPRGYRAVGLANNKNPISIIVPCHRVIGADGKLVGYGGGLDMKKRLLNLEKRFI